MRRKRRRSAVSTACLANGEAVQTADMSRSPALHRAKVHWYLHKFPFHEPVQTPMQPFVTYGTKGCLTWFVVPIRVQCWRWKLPMFLVGDDVRRLTVLWEQEVRDSLRRLLRDQGFKARMLSGNSLPQGTSGERDGERGISIKCASSPWPSSFVRKRGRNSPEIEHCSSCVDTNG